MNTLLLVVALCGQLYGDSPEERAARIVADSNERIIDSQERIADQARRDANPDPFDRAWNRIQGKAESPQRIYVQPAAPKQSYDIELFLDDIVCLRDRGKVVIGVAIAVAVFIVYCIKLIKAPPKAAPRKRPEPTLPD